MHSSVLDHPVVPVEWVHDNYTAGARSEGAIVAQNLDQSVYELFLSCPARLTGSSHTESLHLVSEQQYVVFAHPSFMTYFRNLDSIRAYLYAILAGSENAPSIPALRPAADQDLPLQSVAVRAAAELKDWLHITYDDVATMSGLAKRTIHHWRATGAQPRPTTVRQLRQIHVLVAALRGKLGPDGTRNWFRTGEPTPLQLLQSGNIGVVQEAARQILFKRPAMEEGYVASGIVNQEDTQQVDQSGAFMRVEALYTLSDRLPVSTFLEAHPRITTLLLDLATLIPMYFPDAPLNLRVLKSSPTTDAPDGQRLVLFIATDMDEEQAMVHMDRLMRAWHPDPRSRTGNAFAIDLAPGGTAADVDAAVERFMRNHSSEHEAYRDVAQRLLRSTQESAEKSSARAELIASSGNTHEVSSPTGGGDARAVLARLRRRGDAS